MLPSYDELTMLRLLVVQCSGRSNQKLDIHMSADALADFGRKESQHEKIDICAPRQTQ